MTTYYRMTAKLLSPLIVQKKRQSSSPQTLKYLPGSTLRGALAASYLRGGKSVEDEAFHTLFLDNPVHFCNLLPGAAPDKASKILPLTTISCKREPGFDKHGVFDTLAATAASRIGNVPPDKTLWKCPHSTCGEDMKPFSGFWNENFTAPVRFDPDVRVQRHTGIDRTTGTVANSMFFMTQSISDYYKLPDQDEDLYSRQYLSGKLFLDEKQLGYLTPLIENSVFAGADRTRGFGEMKLSLTPTDESEHPVRSLENIEAWNSVFTAKLSELFSSKDNALEQGVYFSVKLESHAVLVDRFLRPVSEIEAFRHPEILPITKITATETIRGWQAAMGLAKPDDIGLSMGSVFLFRYTGNTIDPLKQLLKPLLINGIGLRKEQGFGQLSICDPIHIKERI
ncbi:RAMP superfamily CRISPR-associated protein [Desulfobacter sp.]|uniref:RAMP superfamily CRISPR-associated protein n=1 Tax=Desulfobacter sp. TaxID=2294 RepID=UPI00257F0A11|nr:RAMP superfamily CRISPR-associated protein [Desulfobacter sp.]